MKLIKRNIIVALAIALAGQNVPAQSISEKIVFEERVFNFGTIREADGKVAHTFTFRNTGNTPVEISEINTGCGCLGQVLSKEAVAPGGTGKITISFNPEYKEGFFSKEILVFSNNKQEFNRIWVEGNIIPSEKPVSDSYPYNFGEGLYLRLKVMAFGYMKPGEIRNMELHYANDTDQELTLNFDVDGKKEGLAFVNPGKIPPRGKGVMKVMATVPYFSFEDLSFRLIPFVNQKKLSETLEIKILNDNKPKNTPVQLSR